MIIYSKNLVMLTIIIPDLFILLTNHLFLFSYPFIGRRSRRLSSARYVLKTNKQRYIYIVVYCY